MKFRRPPPGYHQSFRLEQDPATGLYRKREIPHYSLAVDTTIHFQMTDHQLAGMILLLVIIAILFTVGNTIHFNSRFLQHECICLSP